MNRALALSLCAALGVSACDPAVDDDFEDESPAPLEVGSGWSSQDIGTVKAAGSDTFVNGIFTVKASGADIYGTADAFRFVYQRVGGDTTIVARVTGLVKTNDSAKAVVMIREDLSAGSKFVAAELTPVKTNKFREHYRSSKGGTAVLKKLLTTDSVIPSWLRVVRKGNTFTTSYSTSTTATNWKTIASVSVTMSSLVYIGFGATSHADGTLTTAKFEKVGFTGKIPVCTPGARRCNSSAEAELCGADGQWALFEICGNCFEGKCVTETCVLGDRACDGLDFFRCSADGHWTAAGCDLACNSLACHSTCIEPATGDHYCAVDADPQPLTADSCVLHDLHATPCPADPIAQSCMAGQTYLFQYNRSGTDSFKLDTQRYYVCDGGTWQLGS
jgi:hypothetical protein